MNRIEYPFNSFQFKKQFISFQSCSIELDRIQSDPTQTNPNRRSPVGSNPNHILPIIKQSISSKSSKSNQFNQWNIPYSMCLNSIQSKHIRSKFIQINRPKSKSKKSYFESNRTLCDRMQRIASNEFNRLQPYSIKLKRVGSNQLSQSGAIK